jgi:hypothetical protein
MRHNKGFPPLLVAISSPAYSSERMHTPIPSLRFLPIVAPMDCTNTWLADVHAAGGDLEPPPQPEIPPEYLRKPRRRAHPRGLPRLFTSLHIRIFRTIEVVTHSTL